MNTQQARDFFLHELAVVETSAVGRGTRIWAFAHILPGARIGADCNICDHTFIENDVVIGDRVTVQCGVQLWDGITLEDEVYVGPNVTFANDPVPRPDRDTRAEPTPRTLVRTGATIGANATLLLGIRIGQSASIGVGAVVTRDVPDKAIVVGNPARIVGYVDTPPQTTGVAAPPQEGTRESTVRGVLICRLPSVIDLRGSLTFAEVRSQVPFEIQRYFLIYDVASKEVRGEHAHRTLHQFVVCVHGSCHVMVDDGRNREEYLLEEANVGVYIPPMIWGAQYKYSEDAVLLVLASAPYDASDYIRDYSEYLELSGAVR